MIDILLSRGFDINAIDHNRRTLMHHAAMKDNVKAIQRLIELGAADQLSAVDVEGKTAIQLANSYRAYEVAEFLRSLYLGLEEEDGEGVGELCGDCDSKFMWKWNRFIAQPEVGWFIFGVSLAAFLFVCFRVL